MDFPTLLIHYRNNTCSVHFKSTRHLVLGSVDGIASLDSIIPTWFECVDNHVIVQSQCRSLSHVPLFVHWVDAALVASRHRQTSRSPHLTS